ncbi:MAG: flavodoxin [Clostridiales bacterium]|nr:flavodoxin [Clostridiales bacterium]
MSKTAIVYWTSTGNTQAMANAVAAGAAAGGAQADIFTAAQFNSAVAAEYDCIAFGCPAMGAEQLEESEFEPMFNSVKAAASGKKIGIFGSYGWGDGEWMRTWEDDCRSSGLSLVSDGVVCNESPDDGALAECEMLGRALA